MSRKLLVIGSNTIHVYNYINLVRDYFEDVVLLTNEINSNWEVDAEKANFSLGIHSIVTISKIRKIYFKFKPSVVHVHQANSYAFLTILALKKYNIPIVLTAWGSDILLNPHKKFLLKKMVQYILKNVNIVTADSNHVLNSAQNLVSKKLSLHNINFGIEMKVCNKIEKENIIYSNRLHKELYNIDKIILSFSKFVKKNDDWKLVIAGSGEETEVLKDLVVNLKLDKHIEFVGFLNQKENYAYYCKSKIYVSIPSTDSVSISLVEAMVYGCIPFVSNLEANKELIEDGKNGFIEDDLEHIYFEKFIHIDTVCFDKTRKKLGVTFSKEYNRNRYIAIYNEVCK